MSKEFRREVYREGFIDALCGMKPSEEYNNTVFGDEYMQGRKAGNAAKMTAQGLKVRNKIDHLAGTEIFQTSEETLKHFIG